VSETAPGGRAPWRIWADLARAGNFPSVARNVLAALVLSATPPGAWPEWSVLGLAWVAGWLVYAGGATFNDVADTAFDAQHRPERVIPRGAISRRAAAGLAAAQLAAGALLLAWLGADVRLVLALVAVILAYDWLHKRWGGSVVLMGGCRALLALTLASLPGHVFSLPLLLWVAGLFLYIVVLSLLARREYRGGPQAGRLGRAVGRMLAMIPLVDAVALGLIGAGMAAVACAAAYPLGRWAQRIAAAT
jgi:4-hydroxybenzoate polyprenyltransferase